MKATMWLRSLLVLTAMILGLMAFPSCGSNGTPMVRPPSEPDRAYAPTEMTESAPALAKGGTSSPDRLITRTASLDLLVDSVSATMDSITNSMVAIDGFIVSSQLSGEGDTQVGWMSVRVPVNHLAIAIETVRSMAVRVQRESTSALDVTEEYVDLTSRLIVLQKAEEQYLRLLEQAKTVQDILKVQQEASRVQAEIEQLKGRMQYLETVTATSLITINLRPATSGEPLVQKGWSPLETVKSSVRGLTGFGLGLADFFIRAAIFAPIWGSIIGITWLSIRWVRRRKKNPPSRG